MTRLVLLAVCVLLIAALPAIAQEPRWSDKPTGFASVPALGLKDGTTGGAGGETVVVDNQADLERYIQDDTPRIVRVKGTITLEPFGRKMNVGSNKTIIGIGADATISQGGFRAINQSNIILRNLTIRDSYVEGDDAGKENDFDGFQIDNSHHIWIDHCHFTRLGDGLIDSRKGTDYITVSWCILSNHNKTFGIGWTDRTDWHMTIHHTWFRNTQRRNPSFDQGIGHLFNNYFQDLTAHGLNVRGGAKVVLENSVFENVKSPIIYSGDDAALVARGNVFKNSPDAAEPRGEAFDPRKFYEYDLAPAEDVPALLRAGAGPQASIGN